MSIGNLTSHSVLLGVLGFFIIAILASRNISRCGAGLYHRDHAGWAGCWVTCITAVLSLRHRAFLP
ncbi:hypothetical protein ACLB6M_11695 [Enterobacter hormaechei]